MDTDLKSFQLDFLRILTLHSWFYLLLFVARFQDAEMNHLPLEMHESAWPQPNMMIYRSYLFENGYAE